MKLKVLFITILILICLIPKGFAQALKIIPNDPYFDTQYYIPQTQTDQAWSYEIGTEEVVVAVIDSGIDIDHPDLEKNIWKNNQEIPNNNKDDDQNGYIDDVFGWNFVENNNDPNPQFNDYSTEGASHGTLVAGIIAAQGHNNKGLAGITWNSKIMAIRALNSKGEGSITDAVAAIRYAVKNKADIINLSFVGNHSTPSFLQAIKEAYKAGIILIAAVGNDAIGSASLSGGNLDKNPVYPACFNSPFDDYILGVGAVDKNNHKTSFSNFGKKCIDINAPGVEIVGTQAFYPEIGSPFNAQYSGFWNGTSFAAPQVSGVAALIKSINPKYNNKEIASLILSTADSLKEQNPEYQNKLGAGLLNARRALKAAAPIGLTPSDPLEITNIQRNSTAVWLNDQVPSTVTANDRFLLPISFKNTGTINWKPFFLEIKPLNWQGQSSKFYPNNIEYQKDNTVLPSQTARFSPTITAPSEPGIYQVKFQLIYKKQAITGGALYKTIKVISNKPVILNKHNLPLAVLKNWGSISVQITLTNNTQDSWQKDNLVLNLKTADKNFKITNQKIESNQIVKPKEKINISFKLVFQNSAKKIHYYTLSLKNNNQALPIEGGEIIIRID